jgi:hypothetical protein
MNPLNAAVEREHEQVVPPASEARRYQSEHWEFYRTRCRLQVRRDNVNLNIGSLSFKVLLIITVQKGRDAVVQLLVKWDDVDPNFRTRIALCHRNQHPIWEVKWCSDFLLERRCCRPKP